MYRALFLDRDGVIVENRASYIREWGHVEIFPQALQALAQIRDTPFKTIIVTNQSAIGRGLITLKRANAINDRLVDEIRRHGGRIDDVYMCPHGPDANCLCRKPLPGLLLQAAEALDIDLSASFMIGDALTDVAAGHAAGVARSVLVRTGRGVEQLAQTAGRAVQPGDVYDTLSDALTDLLLL